MRLHPVGISGSAAGPGSPASCYLLEAEGPALDADGAPTGEDRTWRVVLDLGSGAYGPLQALLDPSQLDAVLLSHLHADHCLDVSGLYVAATYGPRPPAEPVLVLAPAGAAERLHRAYEVDPVPGGVLDGVLRHRAWVVGEVVRVGPFTVEPFELLHSVTSYGLRVTGPGADGAPRTLAYTGDTDSCPALVELARDVDVLLTEASFPEVEHGGPELRGVHLTGRRAGEAAREAGARRVLVTHVPAWTDPQVVLAEAREAFGPGAAEAVTLAVAGAWTQV